VRYTTALKSKPYFFKETSEAINLKYQGLTNVDIKKKIIEENIFRYKTESRKKEVASTILKRLTKLDEYIINEFNNSSIEQKKFIILYAILKTDRLFFEFMIEVFREKFLRREYKLKDIDFEMFLRDKAIKLGLKPGPAFGKLHRGIPVRLGDKIIKPEEVLGKPRKGIKITYSGDTRPSQNLVKLARDSHILIHEATFEAGKEDKAMETGHSTASEAAEIAKKSNVKNLILTHLSTRYKRSDIIEMAAREIFKDSIVAHDLMSVEVRKYATKHDN